MTEASYYNDILRSVFDGKKVVLAVDVLVAAGGMATRLRELGADPVLAISGTQGTGSVPDDIEYVMVGSDGAPTVVQNIRAFEHALLHLPDDALRTLDRVDPDREAVILGSFFTPPVEIAGRRVYGGRPKEWDLLEDKVVNDAFFDAAGVTRAPSRIVAPSDLRDTGVVVAGDAREGFNGAAEYVRWIRSEADLHEARAFFADHCDEVRVMEFLEGIPCSIHGVVIKGDVIALRPVEMLTLRRPSSRFLYAGCATYWDPPDDDRAYMREVARKAGAMLRDRYGYRGAFTVDGVLTDVGFRPTELNPRAGAGSAPMMAGSGVPFALLNKTIIEDEPLDFRPTELEELIVAGADAQRAGGAHTSFTGEAFPQQTHDVIYEMGSYRLARKAEPHDGTITLGASGVGRFVLFAPDPASIPVGPSFAPRAVKAFALIDERFRAGFGPLEAAEPVA